MARRKWIRTESQYADDGIMICVEPDGLISLRLVRRRKAYTIPASTLYEALRARDVLGLSGTTVPLLALEPGRDYSEVGSHRRVYLFRLADVKHGRRRLPDGVRWHWWILPPDANHPTLGEGTADSEDLAIDATSLRLAWLELNARFVEDRPPGDEEPAGDAGLDTSKT